MRNTKIQRWGILFEEFGAIIKYRPGPNNVRADMLSRIESGTELAVIDMSSEWVNLQHPNTNEDNILPDDIDKELLIRQQEIEFANERNAAKEQDSGYLLNNNIW